MSDFNFGERRFDIPEVPDNVRRLTGTLIILLILAISGVVVMSTATVRVPSGTRGVLLTWGKVEDKILEEGLNFKIPFTQTVVLMNTQIQKAESTEATATADLQEVSTTVAVNYRGLPYNTLHSTFVTYYNAVTNYAIATIYHCPASRPSILN